MFILDPAEISFPDPAQYGDSEGLLALGGDLSPERLQFAYEHGIFPWFNEDEEILWWSPDPRFVLFPAELRISKSMKKVLTSGTFRFTENRDFEAVIRNCAAISRRGQDGTWITEGMIKAYTELHRRGVAKSVEVWQGEELVGGLYGIDLGHIFCGESMFARTSNASKAGFIYFVLRNLHKYKVIDCQTHTAHLESLGARMIPKLEFLNLLHQKP